MNNLTISVCSDLIVLPRKWVTEMMELLETAVEQGEKVGEGDVTMTM